MGANCLSHEYMTGTWNVVNRVLKEGWGWVHAVGVPDCIHCFIWNVCQQGYVLWDVCKQVLGEVILGK